MKKKQKNKKILDKKTKAKILPFFIILFLILSFFSFPYLYSEKENIGLNQLVLEINENKVDKLVIIDRQVRVLFKDKTEANVIKETDIGLSQSLLNLGVSPEMLKKIGIEFQDDGKINQWLIPLLITALPSLFIIFLFWSIFKQAKEGTMKTFDFTQAKARLFGAKTKEKEKISFGSVGGLEGAKKELREIIDFLKTPKKFFQIGAKIPRGVLLVGPPGCGKTLLARAVASEADVPFFSISGSEFIELFVGVGASRVRSLFSQAKKVGRAIIFIDEIDSIGRTRGLGYGGGHEEREQTLNQILSEMDGFERKSGVIIMAATNRPETLDPALLRPGRFDRRIVLDMPDIKDRKKILEIHCLEKPLASNVDIKEVAERTPGFSGADLENLVNEAAIFAARQNKTKIFQEDFLESIETVLLGPERESHLLSKKEKRITAFHEAGHALVSAFTPNSEQVRKISIVARGMAAGYTLKMPKEEKRIKSKSEFLAELSILFGGYIAEKLKFGEVTTGASNDLKKASLLAGRLVKKYGMSALGPISFGERPDFSFLPGESTETVNYSEGTALKIDEEIASILKQAQVTAEKILIEQKGLLEKLANVLIEKETIEKQEFEEIITKS